MEEPIIEPVSKELLKSELTPKRQLRMTNKSHNEIYVITAHNAPNVMREIGRLREIAFREAGGGTGKPLDIDEFDTCDNCYKQLIVWNPKPRRLLVATDICWDKTGSSTTTGNLSLPQATCSTSPTSFLRSICPTQ